MKVLIIGSGGREHALAWKFAQSANVTEVLVAPGNGGTALEAKCRNIPLSAPVASKEGIAECLQATRAEKIDLCVIGPEDPLAVGIVDQFRAAGIAVIGPDQAAAQLEASKSLSKDFMQKHGVRTAGSSTCDSLSEASTKVREHFAAAKAAPLVIKADGLAAGKGVVIAENLKVALETLDEFMSKGSLGDAGKTIVLEEFLRGVEVSVLAAVSVEPGKAESATIVPFISARDHKRRYEGARGPNTGGMGAIAPVPDFTETARKDFKEHILQPTLKGLIQEGYDYRGFIFFGLMIEENRCSLLEYNVRLGDPETQAVLPLMNSKIDELCQAMLTGTLKDFPISWSAGASCAPVMVAEGYPSAIRKGDTISIDQETLKAADVRVFVAGALLQDGELRTSGGRVLAVSAKAADAEQAREKAYAGIKAIQWNGMGFRTDIGTEKAEQK
jgi:phosphoribosylamine---glycine ligase